MINLDLGSGVAQGDMIVLNLEKSTTTTVNDLNQGGGIEPSPVPPTPVNPDSSTAVDPEQVAEIVNDMHKNIEFLDKLGMIKKADYFYEAWYDGLEYDQAYPFFESIYYPIGACSGMRSGNFVGRSYDWYYDTAAEVLVHTNVPGFHSTIGVACITTALTETMANEGVNPDYIDVYKMLPFMCLDGINDAGVCCQINVVPTGDKGRTTGHNDPSKQKICALQVVRYLLDRADTALDAVHMLENDLDVYMPMTEAVNLESHWMISDATGSYIVEFANNNIVVFSTLDDEYGNMPNEKPVITNFYFDGFDGNIITGFDSSVGINPDDTTLTPHAMGLERYQTLLNMWGGANTKEGMRAAMEAVKYTKAYTGLHGENAWYSEFLGELSVGDLTLYMPLTHDYWQYLLGGVVDYLYQTRDRSTMMTWQSVHQCVYDIENRKAYVCVQEEPAEYEFSLADNKFGYVSNIEYMSDEEIVAKSLTDLREDVDVIREDLDNIMEIDPIGDASVDGKQYTRCDGEWKELNLTGDQRVTYDELMSLIEDSKLIPGMWYRITDYVTTTTQIYTSSDGHRFDILVQANSYNTLNEQCGAALNDDDNYFQNRGVTPAAIRKWKLWYSVYNDTNRFSWADPENGKGVIYRMIDNNNNDCPYDFKNIMFMRSYDSTYGTYTNCSSSNGIWCHTFCSESGYGFPSTSDMSTYNVSPIAANKIEPLYLSPYIAIQKLNNVVMFSAVSFCVIEQNCYNITITGSSAYFRVGSKSHDIMIKECGSSDQTIIGSGCSYVYIKGSGNKIGTECSYVNMYSGGIMNNNIVGDYCESITLSANMSNSSCSNVIGSRCSNISLSGASSNIIGDCCNYITILASGSYECDYNVIGHHSTSCSLLGYNDSIYYNTIGNWCLYIYLGDGDQYVRFGDGCKYVSIIDKTSANPPAREMYTPQTTSRNVRNVVIEPNTMFCHFRSDAWVNSSSGDLCNYTLCRSLSGADPSNCRVVVLERGLTDVTNVGLVSGVIKSYIPGDVSEIDTTAIDASIGAIVGEFAEMDETIGESLVDLNTKKLSLDTEITSGDVTKTLGEWIDVLATLVSNE